MPLGYLYFILISMTMPAISALKNSIMLPIELGLSAAAKATVGVPTGVLIASGFWIQVVDRTAV